MSRALTLGHPAPDPRWIARSIYYADAAAKAADAEIVEEIKAICDDFAAYGYRRVDAEQRHRGYVVDSTKIRHLMLARPHLYGRVPGGPGSVGSGRCVR